MVRYCDEHYDNDVDENNDDDDGTTSNVNSVM